MSKQRQCYYTFILVSRISINWQRNAGWLAAALICIDCCIFCQYTSNVAYLIQWLGTRIRFSITPSLVASKWTIGIIQIPDECMCNWWPATNQVRQMSLILPMQKEVLVEWFAELVKEDIGVPVGVRTSCRLNIMVLGYRFYGPSILLGVRVV